MMCGDGLGALPTRVLLATNRGYTNNSPWLRHEWVFGVIDFGELTVGGDRLP